jgi:hypothetical protein
MGAAFTIYSKNNNQSKLTYQLLMMNCASRYSLGIQNSKS